MKKTDDDNYIHQLINEGEHIRQDFKFAISDARKIAHSLSAFANTKGGKLLIGVKDNGKIAGIHSDEEAYMIEAAAQIYCRPKPDIHIFIHKVDKKDILEVQISENNTKPVYAIDEHNKGWAYMRIGDENILANPVQLEIWKKGLTKKDTFIKYSEQEKSLLNLLEKHKELTLNQCCRMVKLKRKHVCTLLADFIRFGLVKQIFKKHTFYFCPQEES